MNEFVVAASKDTSFELFQNREDQYAGGPIEPEAAAADPQRAQIERTKTQLVQLLNSGKIKDMKRKGTITKQIADLDKQAEHLDLVLARE